MQLRNAVLTYPPDRQVRNELKWARRWAWNVPHDDPNATATAK